MYHYVLSWPLRSNTSTCDVSLIERGLQYPNARPSGGITKVKKSLGPRCIYCTIKMLVCYVPGTFQVLIYE